ncbi:hypothetical protein F4823DRAFT_637874 [Ustulina deusta]|nr:hypothetical protein F4823DRAFT_637874 [Ustulina deusta]
MASGLPSRKPKKIILEAHASESFRPEIIGVDGLVSHIVYLFNGGRKSPWCHAKVWMATQQGPYCLNSQIYMTSEESCSPGQILAEDQHFQFSACSILYTTLRSSTGPRRLEVASLGIQGARPLGNSVANTPQLNYTESIEDIPKHDNFDELGSKELSYKLPILAVPEPEKADWDFLEIFGVTVKLTPRDMISRLRQLKEFGEVLLLYRQIQDCIDNENLGFVRDAFKEHNLVFLALGHEPSPGVPYRLDHIRAVFIELCQMAQGAPATQKWATRFHELPRSQIYPVGIGKATLQYDYPGSGSVTNEKDLWYIADLPYLFDSFVGVGPLLAFTPSDLKEMKPLIQILHQTDGERAHSLSNCHESSRKWWRRKA